MAYGCDRVTTVNLKSAIYNGPFESQTQIKAFGGAILPLLEVQNLTIAYDTPTGPLRAVRNVSLDLDRGETLALVGETGSGKTTLALSLISMLGHSARLESGRVLFEGRDLTSLRKNDWRTVRGPMIGMIFQDPGSSLNPVLTIGSQLLETMRAHRKSSRKQFRQEALRLLGEVGIPDPAHFMRRYPLELSGGMCQRAAIALALCNSPSLLIADEPTSALDPTIQGQVLDLLAAMQRSHRLTLLLVSHDLALVARRAARVAVMYGGRLVEWGDASKVFAHPAHPYTEALLKCLPKLEQTAYGQPVHPIDGSPPSPFTETVGCVFAPRCGKAGTDCRTILPDSHPVSDQHWVACIKAE